jgi:hypothetical protein
MDKSTHTKTSFPPANFSLPAAKPSSLINVIKITPLRAAAFSLDNLQLSARKKV